MENLVQQIYVKIRVKILILSVKQIFLKICIEVATEDVVFKLISPSGL